MESVDFLASCTSIYSIGRARKKLLLSCSNPRPDSCLGKISRRAWILFRLPLFCYTLDMTAEEKIASLEAQLKQALERLDEVTEQLRVAQGRIEELEKLKMPPPAFVKANKKKAPEEQKKARKKRDAQHNRARPRSLPTQIVEHRLVTCPECHLRLGGLSLARCREVIDVPPPPAVEVTEHRIYKGWWAGCHHWYEAPLAFPDQLLVHGRR